MTCAGATASAADDGANRDIIVSPQEKGRRTARRPARSP